MQSIFNILKILMKIFPTKNYKIELIDNFEKNIQILRLNTLQSNSLSTKLTNKEFIGRINGNHFEIINSKVGIGAFTVLKGDFSNHSVNIVAEVNTPFKILISIIFTFGISGFFYNAFKIGFPNALGMLVPFTMLVGLLRFVFLGLIFERSFNLIYEKFTNLLNVNTY